MIKSALPIILASAIGTFVFAVNDIQQAIAGNSKGSRCHKVPQYYYDWAYLVQKKISTTLADPNREIVFKLVKPIRCTFRIDADGNLQDLEFKNEKTITDTTRKEIIRVFSESSPLPQGNPEERLGAEFVGDQCRVCI